MRLPVLAVAFQSTRLSGSPGLCGRMPRNSDAPRLGTPAPAVLPAGAHVGEQRAGGEVGEARVDGDVQRVAELRRVRTDEAQRVLGVGDQRRQVMDAAPRRRGPVLATRSDRGPEALEVHLAVVAAQVAGGMPEGDLQAGHERAVLDPERRA